MRKVTIVSTNTDEVFDIESSAETWGELKREGRLANIVDGMKAIVRETKNTLENDQAIIPQSEFVLYLSPSKVKSGWTPDDISDIDELIDMASYGDKVHLVRFLKVLKSRTTLTPIQDSEDENFPIIIGKSSTSTRNAELLKEAKSL